MAFADYQQCVFQGINGDRLTNEFPLGENNTAAALSGEGNMPTWLMQEADAKLIMSCNSICIPLFSNKDIENNRMIWA